jgi:hypothetical protein
MGPAEVLVLPGAARPAAGRALHVVAVACRQVTEGVHALVQYVPGLHALPHETRAAPGQRVLTEGTYAAVPVPLHQQRPSKRHHQ